jgi:hypothetical protein
MGLTNVVLYYNDGTYSEPHNLRNLGFCHYDHPNYTIHILTKHVIFDLVANKHPIIILPKDSDNRPSSDVLPFDLAEGFLVTDLVKKVIFTDQNSP